MAKAKELIRTEFKVFWGEAAADLPLGKTKLYANRIKANHKKALKNCLANWNDSGKFETFTYKGMLVTNRELKITFTKLKNL